MDTLNTLFLPLEREAIAVPASGRTVFWGARAHPFLARFRTLSVRQDFYPAASALSAYSNETQDCTLALCLLPRQAEEARHDMAQAALALREGGVLVAAAANDAGGNRIEGWMRELGFNPQSLSKNKARVCWGVKDELSDCARKWVDSGIVRPVEIEGRRWMSQPGIFGWNKADQGSKLLLDHVPGTLAGNGADLGCGYGYLGRFVLERSPAIRSIVCIDADRRAVSCCEENIEDPRATCVWGDVCGPEIALAGLDWIVMNPPFHDGKKTTKDLGQAFIQVAARALKPGGVLYMVANAHLPYEKILDQNFKTHERLAQAKGFKVFRAVK